MELEYDVIVYLKAQTRLTINENTVREITGIEKEELTSEDWDAAALKIANLISEDISIEDIVEIEDVEVDYRG